MNVASRRWLTRDTADAALFVMAVAATATRRDLRQRWRGSGENMFRDIFAQRHAR